MKKIWLAILLALILCGCGRGENPYRVDTVIRIPANPTEPASDTREETRDSQETEGMRESEAAETAPDSETSEPTSEETEGTTAPTEKKTTGKKTTTKKNSNKKTESKKETEPTRKENGDTQPPATEQTENVPAAEPTQTEPPATEPPATEPPVTEPPATEPPATEPPVTEPQETESPPARYDISGYVQDSVGYSVAEKINEVRSAADLPELSLDSYLSAIASCRAYEVSQVWSHTRPDGRDYASVLGDYGYSGTAAGELLVYMTGSGDGADMVRKWTENDGTRARILAETVETMGVGVFRANGYTFVCLLFAA